MFIIAFAGNYGIGETIEEAVMDFENYHHFEPDFHEVYEAKEIKVQRKFEVIKED